MGRKILFWFVGAIVVLVAAAALVTLIGVFLPEEHSFARSARISQPPETLWQVITDYAAQPSWRPDVKRMERLPDRSGHEAWEVTDKYDIAMTMEVLESAPPRRQVEHYIDEKGSAKITWEFEITPAEAGSRVTLRERGTFSNPFYRAIGRLFFGTKFADDYLRYLAARFGETVIIQ